MTASPAKIQILYFEGDEGISKRVPMTRLVKAEWLRDGAFENGYGMPYHGEPGIPDDVRVALAMLIAPGLVKAV